MCVGVSVWLVGVVSVWQAEAVLQPATRILFRKTEGKESFTMRMNCTEEREIVPFIYSSLTPCC